MEGRREEEHSMFETSHILGAHVASSPLLPQAWRQCSLANAGATSFVVEQVGDVVYVSFSGVQTIDTLTGGAGGGFFNPVPIGSTAHGLFSPLVGDDDGEPVLVHSSSLHLFLTIYSAPEFQMLVTETRNRVVIFTGHSIGGSLASLATLYFLCSSSRSTSPSPSPSPASLLCITFGSPLLGNDALSRAVLRERWGGNFCQVVSQHDVVPRLLFCPPDSISPQLITHLLQSWQLSMRFLDFARTSLQSFVSLHIAAAATNQNSSATDQLNSPYRPFGCYVLCSAEGAVCIDSPLIVVRMLYLTFVTGSASCSMEDEHISYGDLVVRISQLLLLKKRIAIEEEVPMTNYGAGVSLALEASGIGIQDMGAIEARECLKLSKRMGRSPNLNCAHLAVRLAKITPCRAQIEWYKACCDDDMGYYDAFKSRKASKRESKVNMNRIKLARFWDDLVDMLQNNQLPHDFHKRAKWVNAAHFYKLLVEPLDIAEYYRGRVCKTKGHYLTHGRERRYEVFDKWWRDGKKDLHSKRSKFAGLTQDSCFWAKVEEAKEWMENARTEMDSVAMAQLWEKLNGFELYAEQLVARKEVSRDVLAPHSSYSLWVEEWKDLKLNLVVHIPP